MTTVNPAQLGYVAALDFLRLQVATPRTTEGGRVLRACVDDLATHTPADGSFEAGTIELVDRLRRKALDWPVGDGREALHDVVALMVRS